MRPPDATAGEDDGDVARARADRGRAGPVRPAHALRRAAARAPGAPAANHARARARRGVTGCASTASSRASSAAAAGTWTRASPRCSRSSATPTARARAFRPAYLAAGRAAARRSSARVARAAERPAPARAAVDALARHGARARPSAGCRPYVHVYFHDTDLLARRAGWRSSSPSRVLARRRERHRPRVAEPGVARRPRPAVRQAAEGTVAPGA